MRVGFGESHITPPKPDEILKEELDVLDLKLWYSFEDCTKQLSKFSQ